MNVIALYDYEPTERYQLKFSAGDQISVVRKDASGWWDGILHGNRGWFPSNFVKEVKYPKIAIPDASVESETYDQRSGDLSKDIQSLKINSALPNKVTPIFAWPQAKQNNEISQMCDEILSILGNHEHEYLKKRVNNLIAAVKELLVETDGFSSVKEQKSWISSLILSLSKKNKIWSNNPTAEEIEEIGVMVGGISDATHDLFKMIGNDETQDSISLSSSKASDRIVRIRGSLKPLIQVDENKYPSPQSSDRQFNLNHFPLVASNLKVGDQYSYELILNQDKTVNAGKIDALLNYFKDNEKSDHSFNTEFLATYKLFLSSKDLFRYLCDTLEPVQPHGISADELKKWKETCYFKSVLSTLSILRLWIENYLLLNSEDADLTALLYEFSNMRMEKLLPRAGEQLVRILDRRIRNIPNIAIKPDCPPPRIPSTFDRMRFIELDPLEMARQLTLMYSEAFEKTRAHNLIFPDVSVRRNLGALNFLHHQVSSWVSHSILLENDLDKRISILNHFILLSERNFSLNNFQTCYDIIKGLKIKPVLRLSKTWKGLPAKMFKLFTNLSEGISSKLNYLEYRKVLETVKGPCIPLIPCHLQDLRHTHSELPTYTERGMVNFQKMKMLSKSIHILLTPHVHKYAFTHVPEFQLYFKQCFADEVDEHTMMQLSYFLEPNQKQVDKIANNDALKSLKNLGII